MADPEVAAPAVPAPAPPAGERQAPTAPRRRRLSRALLMLFLPVVLAAGGGWYWVEGGRWVSTDNAYVTRDKVQIGAEVGGRIAEVSVRENEAVREGDVLFRIDPEPYRIALAKAEGAVAAARLQVAQLRTGLREAELGVDEARETLAYEETQFDRQSRLLETGSTTQARYDETRHGLALARQSLAQAEQAVRNAVAALDGNRDIATDDHPLVRQALAAAEGVRLDLARTEVRAPADGLAAQVAGLQVGRLVSAGTPVMAVVEAGPAWVEANFKETDLAHLAPGQHAELGFDAYPGAPVSAHVESIGAGTGATFSVLPAQNATGNWVKVVQRVPVRLVLDDPAPTPLIAGLSVDVDVDTGHVRPLPGAVRDLLAALGVGPVMAGEDPAR